MKPVLAVAFFTVRFLAAAFFFFVAIFPSFNDM